MNWGGVQEFLAMGGYAKFVWGSYAVTAVLVIAEIVLVVRRHRAARKRLGTDPLRQGTR